MANPVGTAYIQIMPTSKGIQGSIQNVLDPEAKAAGTSAGRLSGRNLVKAMGGALAAAGVGKFISSSLFAGADLQQSMGGIETLYKGASDKMMKYANQAYMTSGVSANDYMEVVTSYSAGLISSMGGDVDAAADVANMAMIDMADNANKMGVPIERLQDAYRGFGRGNFTMLDNLSLGYGGTRTEMQRLLDDANKINREHGIMSDYSIDNLADIYNAIHTVQNEMGITGTTQKEASQTISGSIGMMKASYQDLIANMALGNDIYPNMVALVNSVITVARNVLPALGSIIMSIPRMIIEHFPEIKTAITTAITNVVTTITTNGPKWLKAAGDAVTKFANGIITNFPTILKNIGAGITKAVTYIGQASPKIVAAAARVLANVGKTLLKNLPAIIRGIIRLAATTLRASFNLIKTTITSAITGIKTFIKTAFEGTKIARLVSGLKGAITAPFKNAYTTIKGIIDKIKGFFPINIGKILDGIRLPKISVSGGKAPWGIAGKGSLPQFNVEWMAQGGIMTRPTFFAGGEAGDEGIIPLRPFWARLDAMADNIAAQNNGSITVNVYGAAGQDVNALADAVQARLISMEKRRRYAWQ